jgi:hypothetical protein
MPNNFSYNNNVPFATNSPAVDQPEMLKNTKAISSIIGIDHVDFGTNGSGIHKQVTLLNVPTSGTPPGLGDGNGVIYSDVVAGLSRPFWQDSALTVFQMLVSNPLETNIVQNGYINIGGLILQWGVVNGTHGINNFFDALDSGTTLFNIPFPSNCFGVLANGLWSSSASSAPSSNFNLLVDLTTQTITSFNWIVNTNSNKYTQFFWFAVGN